MRIGITTGHKILIVFICFSIAIIGFMVKLPFRFRHLDKELHVAFYFLAAALLNILFAQTKIVRHIIIFGLLYLFGIAIEYAQDYSNRFFRSRIHGRFDPEDVQSNLKGLIAFSIVWLLWAAITIVYKKIMLKETEYNSKSTIE